VSPLAPYPSPEIRDAEFADLTRAAGGELVTYGESVEGRALLAARVPSRSASAVPRVLCAANIHGLEFIGGRVALELLKTCSAPAPALSEAVEHLRARAELWIIPCLNPDGYARTWAQDGHANAVAPLRQNANGVDLNRNFPRPGDAPPSRWPGAGSDRPGDATYRGTHALSEPESAQLNTLLSAQAFHASANLHSFMGTLIPARVTTSPPFCVYKYLCRQFANHQAHTRYRRLSLRALDVFTGELEDHQHHVHDAWAVCVESFPLLSSLRQHLRAPSVFWRFNPRAPQRWIDNEVPGLLAFFAAALDMPRPSRISLRQLPAS
jgi:hypothetical protein